MSFEECLEGNVRVRFSGIYRGKKGFFVERIVHVSPVPNVWVWENQMAEFWHIVEYIMHKYM